MLLFLFFLGEAGAGFSQVDRGLISSYYFFGNARDSVGGNHGKVAGASLAADRFGNPDAAYCFDGEDDYITLGANTSLRQINMSISLWVRINDFTAKRKNLPAMPFITTRVRHTVEYYEAYTISLFLDKKKFATSNNSLSQVQVANIASFPAEKEKWYHAVLMFDSDSSYLYINGRLEQKNYKGFLTTYHPEDSVVLGFDGNHMPDTFTYLNYSYLKGCLDDIKFYNRLLSQDEILELYHEPDPKKGGHKVTSLLQSDILKTFWYVPVALIVFVILTILFVRWRLKMIQKREQQKMEVERQLAQMEMRALRGQMNPHFIFNAINSIQHYVLTNEKNLANKYLVKFSQLMRNILELSKQELISLKDELENISLYLDIESLRFDNAFNYSITISPGLNIAELRLPPLIIQPFVENAIWHGLLLKKGIKNLEIIVEERKDTVRIVIDDNGIGRQESLKYKNNELKRKSFGMEITSERLQMLEKIFGIVMKYQIIDKMDLNNEPSGTRVILDLQINTDDQL